MSIYLNFSHCQQTIDHFSWNSWERDNLTLAHVSQIYNAASNKYEYKMNTVDSLTENNMLPI